MRASAVRIVSLTLVGLVLAACGSATPSPTPQPSPPPDAKVLLRVTMQQALPPPSTFSWLPQIVISLDGRVLTGGAVPAIFPGPLVNPIIERSITQVGWAKIVAAARAAGLLGGAKDFTGGGVAPGGMTARLQIVADGKEYDLVGDPSRIMVCVTTPCVPEPGTPEAFGGFLNRLTDLVSMVGAADLGPEHGYVPTGWALLVGPPPANDPNLPQPAANWPLPGGLGAFGKATSDGSGSRCGTLTGDDAAAVGGSLLAANQLTPWRDPVDGSMHGLQVRPVLPGDDDPCTGLV